MLSMFSQLTPGRANGRSKGKGTDDPIRFLPVLPSKRSKPVWQQNQPNFELSGKILGDDKNGIDLVGELTASKSNNYKNAENVRTVVDKRIMTKSFLSLFSPTANIETSLH